MKAKSGNIYRRKSHVIVHFLELAALQSTGDGEQTTLLHEWLHITSQVFPSRQLIIYLVLHLHQHLLLVVQLVQLPWKQFCSLHHISSLSLSLSTTVFFWFVFEIGDLRLSRGMACSVFRLTLNWNTDIRN